MLRLLAIYMMGMDGSCRLCQLLELVGSTPAPVNVVVYKYGRCNSDSHLKIIYC